MTAYLSDVPTEIIDRQALQRLIGERHPQVGAYFTVVLRYGPHHGQRHSVPFGRRDMLLAVQPSLRELFTPEELTKGAPMPRRVVYEPSGDYTLPHLIPVWTPIDHPSRKKSNPS